MRAQFLRDGAELEKLARKKERWSIRPDENIHVERKNWAGAMLRVDRELRETKYLLNKVISSVSCDLDTYSTSTLGSLDILATNEATPLNSVQTQRGMKNTQRQLNRP